MSQFSLSPTGYFRRDGKPFWPVGVNYVAASCGARPWRAWPTGEIHADLAAMQRLGFNTVRFFLAWDEFEPQPGRYDPAMERRLQEFGAWCAEFGLAVHPSLFIGWMSGAIFWPAWKRGRNLFEDPELRERSLAFAERCATILRACPNLFAIDVGNEMSCLPDAHEAHPDAVRDWCRELLQRVRRILPEVLIVPGNEQMAIFKEQGFRLTDDVGWDFLSAHGYPVPKWNEAWLPGLQSPETQRRLPFYVKFLRAFGPVLLQEFGTIATFGAEEQRAYLAGMLDRAWRAGANGFLFWCWKDTHSPHHPYTKGGIERTLGLVTAAGEVKAGLEPFVEFTRDLHEPPAPPNPVALLLPQEWYARDNQRNPGNAPAIQCEQYAGADSILDELGRTAVITRRLGDAPTIIPGAALRDDEIAALIPAIRAGHRLLWWSPSFYCWGPAARELIGAEIVDFYPDHAPAFTWQGRDWQLAGFPEKTMPVVRHLATTRVDIRDHVGRPLLLRHRLGQGEIWTLLPLCRTDAHPAQAGERAFATALMRAFLG